MAALKNIYSNLNVRGDIDLYQNELQNAVIHVVSGTNVISSPVEGQIVFDNTANVITYYNGTEWKSVDQLDVSVMNYKGVIGHDGTPSTPNTGDMYIFNSAGTATNFGSAVVQIGDFAIYNGSGWEIVQGNVVEATTSAVGYVQLDTDANVIANTNSGRVVTSGNLEYVRTTRKLVSSYDETIASLSANSATTVTHSLNTQNVIVQCYDQDANSNWQEIVLDVISTGANTITVESTTALTNVKIVVTGYKSNVPA